MTPKILKLFDELEQDLRLTDLDVFANRLAHIKKSLAPVQKKKAIASKQPFKLEITEGFSSYDLYLDSEKEVLAFMSKKQKERKTKIDLFLKSKDKSFPSLDSYGGNYAERLQQYKNRCLEHLQLIKDAGLNFEVNIIAPPIK